MTPTYIAAETQWNHARLNYSIRGGETCARIKELPDTIPLIWIWNCVEIKPSETNHGEIQSTRTKKKEVNQETHMNTRAHKSIEGKMRPLDKHVKASELHEHLVDPSEAKAIKAAASNYDNFASFDNVISFQLPLRLLLT